MPDLHTLLAQSAAMHEHLCPKQVLGVRMGLYAAELLRLGLPQTGKRLLTIVETDGCFTDGIAVSTGCWLGHRTLRCVDYGKVAATFVDTVTGDAVRIHPSEGSRKLAYIYAPTAADRWHAYLEGYQVMPAEELFVADQVRLTVPVGALVSSPDRKAVCERCHEEIINGREVESGGHVLCRACASGAYYTDCVPELHEAADGVSR
jgi:formylmethanofuran dehydrogenase subunit E